jgi:Zn-dependent protease with chaperone function
MANSPDSSPSPSSDHPSSAQGTAEQWFRQGLTAYKGGAYQRAISIFAALEQKAPSYRQKAQMGQVRAYQKLGDLDSARRLCQALLNSSPSQVQQWASRNLQLMSPAPISASESGVTDAISPYGPSVSSREIALESCEPENQPAVTENDDHDVVAVDDLSGFTPLPSNSSDSGNRPPLFADTVAEEQLVSPPAAPLTDGSSLATPSSHQPTVKAAEIAVSATDVASTPNLPSASPSLFHYQKLNQGSNPGAPPPSPPSATKAEPQNLDDPQAGESQSPAAATQSRPRALPAATRSAQRRSPPIVPRRPLSLWLVQAITLVATIVLTTWVLQGSLRSFNTFLRWVNWPVRLSPIGVLDRSYTSLVIGVAILLIVSSPWLFDRGLSWLYQQQRLSTRQLKTQSPAAVQLLRRVCRQRGWQLPELRVIPTQKPLCFSYGWLPRNTRITISQGLLDHLSEEQIAALYGYELAHITNWDLPVISGLSLWLFALYSLHHKFSSWGDQVASQPLRRKACGAISAVFYVGFWWFRKLGLWLSRQRSHWCDRVAPMLTRQPIAYQAMLLHVTEQIAAQVSTHGEAHPLLICLDGLMPVSPQQAISPGSFLGSIGLESLVAWDGQNPYRFWLMGNASHPLLGERLINSMRWAQSEPSPPRRYTTDHLDCPHSDPASLPSPSGVTLIDLVIQQGPLLGLLIGGGIAMVLWFVGGIVQALNWNRISWLYQDSSILVGGLLLGFGLGMLLRINSLYPDISVSEVQLNNDQSALSPLLDGPIRLPVAGYPVALKGTLMGPSGLANQLCQQLYLRHSTGTIALKVISPLGPFINWRNYQQHPASWTTQPVTVTGWARRGGGVLWVEVADIRRANRTTFRGKSPIWTTSLSLIASLLGISIIFLGG